MNKSVKNGQQKKEPPMVELKPTIGGFVMPRKYEKVSELLPIIKELISQGKTQQQIAEKLGLSFSAQHFLKIWSRK